MLKPDQSEEGSSKHAEGEGNDSENETTDCEMDETQTYKDSNDNEESMETEENSHEYFLGLLKTDLAHDHIDLQKDVNDLALQLTNLAQSCQNKDVLKTVKQHVQSAISLLIHTSETAARNISNAATNEATNKPKSHDTPGFKKTRDIAPNTNSPHQLRFHSTKKKKKPKQRWAKPTKDEEERAKRNMQKTSVTVCGICWQKEDQITSDTQESCVSWLECEICGLWVHESCSHASQQPSETIDKYICSSCLINHTTID